MGVGLGLGVLAIAGFVWGVSEEMLRAIPSDKRADVLRRMARMRPVGASALPGGPADRSVAVEYRATAPGDWSQSILSWVERMNEEGYSIAYWEAEDPSKTTVVAFRPEEEKALAAHRYRGATSPGWVLLLDPRQFTKLMGGESHEDLLRGTAAVPLPGGRSLFSEFGDGRAPGGVFSEFAELGEGRRPGGVAQVAPWELVATANTKPMGSYPRIGDRYQADARFHYDGGTPQHYQDTWERSIVEGVWRGPEDENGGSLLVDRVVQTFKSEPYGGDEKYLKKAAWAEDAVDFVGAQPAPLGMIYQVPTKDRQLRDNDLRVKDGLIKKSQAAEWKDNRQFLQVPTWAVLDPTSVSARTFDPPLKVAPSLGKKVTFAIRETNPWGNAVLVVDGVVMQADADTPARSVRVGTDSIVRRVRGDKDTVIPKYVYVPIDQLVDPDA